MVGPQRRSSSGASSCVSLECGDQDQGKSNGFSGKSPPGATVTSSPKTPAGMEKSGSPSAMKKRRASIGGADDLARGLDFGTISPSTEEKKHPFLTRGGGHKKVSSPTTQTSSPGKKDTSTTTPPGKEKLVALRATAASSLSPRKSVEAKKDITSPRRSVLGSESSSMNGSLISDGTSCSLVEVTPKKSSPRASVEGKTSAGKPSPRKSVASTIGRKNSNGDSAAIDSSPPEAESKFSPRKSVDVKTRKTSPQSPVPPLKFRPGLTSPKSQKSTKTRQNIPSQPGRTKTRVEKPVCTETTPKPELDTNTAVPVSPETEIQSKSEDIVAPMEEDHGSTLLPSLMTENTVTGDEGMSSLDRSGDRGFDTDMDMPPTSWLSEDLPCMFSSLSSLPEPDDSSSSHLGDPPEVLDEPFAEDGRQDSTALAHPNDEDATVEVVPSSAVSNLDEKLIDPKQKSSELAHLKDEIVATEVTPRSPVASLDKDIVVTGFPNEVDGSERKDNSNSCDLGEDSIEGQCKFGQPCESNERESLQQTSTFPSVVKLVAVSQGGRISGLSTTHPEEISSSSNVSPVTKNVAPVDSLSITENTLTEERNLQILSESRSIQPVSSQNNEKPAEVTQVTVTQSLESNGGVYNFDSSREMDTPYAASALQEEERWTASEEVEVSATPDRLLITSSDDESSEDFIEGSCGAQINLQQSFDDAAEPPVSHNKVDEARAMLPKDSRKDACDLDLEPIALSTVEEILPEVNKIRETEFFDGSRDEQESGTFTQRHIDKDMMIFDFEEYWTQNPEDESFHSDAGQNDAKDLQTHCMREVQLPSSVLKDEAAKSEAVYEVPVSSIPREEFINLESEFLSPWGGAQLDSQGLPCPNSMASFACQMDTKISEEKEFDEVFHLFEGKDHSSPRAVSLDKLSNLEKRTVELTQEPLAPILSQSNIERPGYTTLETEYSNGPGADIGQVNLDGPQDKQVELKVEEHQISSAHTFVTQELSVADSYSPKTDLVLSNDKAQGDDQSLTQEDIDTPLIPSVRSNGHLDTNLHHSDDNHVASDESVDLGGPEDSEFSPVTMHVSSQKSSFENAPLSDGSSDMGPENLSVPQVLEDRAMKTQTAETTDDRDATETTDLLPDAPNRIASPIAGADDSRDLVISPPVDSLKLTMVERDQNILISSAGEEVNPLESKTQAVSLPQVNDISDEELQTEAIFLLSLDNKEDSSTDHELQVNRSCEKPQGLSEIFKDVDSAFLAGGDLISEPREIFQDVSSEYREGEAEVPEHDNIRIRSGGTFPVEESPQEIQSRDDEIMIKTPALRTESSGESVSEGNHQIQMPLISKPETLQDDNETTTERGLPTGVHDENHVSMAVPWSPVSDQDDEIINDKFDSKFEVKSTASLHEDDERIDTLKAASGGTASDTTSPVEILCYRGEATQNSAAPTPPEQTAGKLSKLTLTETDETDWYDDKLGNEATDDEERWRTVSDFGEHGTTADHGWEGPLLATDSSGSDSSTKVKSQLFREESMVTHADVADDPMRLELDMDKSEEAPRTLSTPVSTRNETIQHHDHDFQESRPSLGKSVSAVDQVSRSNHPLEKEDIVPEHVSSQDLALERFLASNQQIHNAQVSDVDEVDSELTRFKEVEKQNETLEPIPLMKDEDTVVENPRKSFILCSQDTAKNVDVEEIEGMSAAQEIVAPEMYTADTFPAESILWMSLDQHCTKETLTEDEDEETVVYIPKNSFVASGTPDSTILTDINGGTHSHVSQTASKEEESLNGNLEEESLPNDELVHIPKDCTDFAAHNLNTTSAGNHGIRASPRKDEEEVSSLVEKPLQKDEDASPKKFSASSGEGTAILDIEELEEHSWIGDKEEKILNENLERGEETMVESSDGKLVSRTMGQFHIPAEETPETTTSDLISTQNHSNNSRSGESFTLEGVSLLGDEDTVVYSPAVEEFNMEGSSPKSVQNVEDRHEEILNAPKDLGANGYTAEESLTVVESLMETSNVPKDTEVCRSKPELMEEPSVECVKNEADSTHKDIFNVSDHETKNAAILVVEEQETQRVNKEGDRLNGNLEQESKLEVEKSSKEAFVAPDVLNANFTSSLVIAEELGKENDKEESLDQILEEKSSIEFERTVMESSKESLASPVLEKATNTSNLAVAELEKQTDKEDEILDHSLDAYSKFKVEETAVESSGKESFDALDTINAKDASNLIVDEKLVKRTGKDEETSDQFLDTYSSFEVEETEVQSSEKEPFSAPDLVYANGTSNLVTAEKLEDQTAKEEKTLDRSLEAKSINGDEVTMLESSEKESFVAPGLLDASDTSNLVPTDQLESSEKESFVAPGLLDASDTSNLVLTDQLESSEKESFVAPGLLDASDTSNLVLTDQLESSEKESFVAPGLLDASDTSNLVLTDQLEKQTDREEQNQSLEAKFTIEVEQTVADITKQRFIAPDLVNAKSSNTAAADELEKQIDQEEESLGEKSTLAVPDTNVESSKETFSVSDPVAKALSAGYFDKHQTQKNPNKEVESLSATNLEEESNQHSVVDSSSDTTIEESACLSEVNSATLFSSGPTKLGANLVASNLDLPDEDAKEPLSNQIADTVKFDSVNNSLDVPKVVQTDTGAGAFEDFSNALVAVEEMSMTNGEKLKDSNSPVQMPNMQGSAVSKIPQADTPPESTVPQSPTATLYPLSEPPFSGSLQDRLWEEQAEAYNSGQGTPSRNEDHATQSRDFRAPSSPKDNPVSSEDQIQPAVAASNGNHTVVVGPSNGSAGSHENGSTPVQDQPKVNVKEKVHTPLRSLLLEESSHSDALTPYGVNDSPSFIRRLFRVVSNSRSVEKDAASQAKLKRSSSMWVSCLGAPQVQK